MIRRLYVHNFRCLENFTLLLKDYSTALVLGDNGTGTTSIASALHFF